MSLFKEISNNLIPDLQSIIVDYCVKDWKPNFNRVILEIESEVLDIIPDYYTWDRMYCSGLYDSPSSSCNCEKYQSFKSCKTHTPKCFDLHMHCLNDLINRGISYHMFNLRKLEHIH